MTKRHNRKLPRHPNYDYSQDGAHFVTNCSYQRKSLFGEVTDGEMIVNSLGEIIYQQWQQTGELREHVELDAFVVMPNHVHGIIMIINSPNDRRRDMMHHVPTHNKRQFSKLIPNSLSSIVGTFKAAVTRQINRLPDSPDHPIWQPRYRDHIIRNVADLNRIRDMYRRIQHDVKRIRFTNDTR